MPTTPDEHPGRDASEADRFRPMLELVAATALDADYAAMARRRDGRPSSGRRPGSGQAIVVVFGLLLATAALTAERSAPAVAAERQRLIAQARARQAQVGSLQELTENLRTEIEAVERRADRTAAEAAALRERLRRLGVLAGTVPVVGPGVRVVAGDAPRGTGGDTRDVVLDVDLQLLVNGLWAAGAEAVAVDGYRLSNLTAIRGAGSAITVDYRSVSSPYVVEAIGDPNTLASRFIETDAGTEWLNLRANFGLRFEISTRERLSLPADTTVALRAAAASGGRP